VCAEQSSEVPSVAARHRQAHSSFTRRPVRMEVPVQVQVQAHVTLHGPASTPPMLPLCRKPATATHSSSVQTRDRAREQLGIDRVPAAPPAWTRPSGRSMRPPADGRSDRPAGRRASPSTATLLASRMLLCLPSVANRLISSSFSAPAHLSFDLALGATSIRRFIERKLLGSDK